MISFITALVRSRAMSSRKKIWTSLSCIVIVAGVVIYTATPAASAPKASDPPPARPYLTFVDGAEGEPPPWPPKP